jgi:N-acetylmuramoyl-L-alanine amidase
MRDIKQIVVHCADTPPSMDIGAKTIRDWHVNDNGWADIGYHYVIRRNGVIEKGRDLDGDGNVDEEVGAHAYGFNKDSIGVCLIGGKGKDGKADANFTVEQYITLAILVRNKLEEYPGSKVVGHRDLSDKPCPGFDTIAFFANITD